MPGSYFSAGITARGVMAKKMLVTSSEIINSTIDMNMKTITSVHDPVNPQDAATRYYVDASLQKVESEFQSFFSGVVVTLKGIAFSEVAHIKPGSYIVTVTPYKDGFPTATFSISKAGAYSAGHVMQMTGGVGNYTPERLELQWPIGGVLSLRKTGPGYDGDYMVDLNVKNMSSLSSPPVLPTDQASKAYVDKVVKEQLEVKFGGVTVQLEGTESVNVMNLRPGSYVVAVTPMAIDGAPTATFSVSKNSVGKEASVMKITGCSGLYTPEQLEITWPENSMLRLRKTGPGYNGMYLVDMNLKNFSSTVTPASIPTDAVTVDYVEREIERKMQAKFGGQIVNLNNTDTTQVVNLRPGSYVISVTPLVTNGPTATFAISKNSPYKEPSIIRTSSCSGVDTGEVLELLWPENSMILLRKTGPFYDGDYIIDFNLKNIQPNALIPTLPSDMASKQYVTHEIGERLKVKFGGLEVRLQDTDFSEIAAIRPGSYMVTIIPTVDGSATASFLISKSIMAGKASIVRMTSAPAADSGEVLELDWPENGKLMLRKTMPFHDGVYIVDMNLKNFTSVAPPIIPTDVASKEYVTDQIKNEMQVKFSGIHVNLIDSNFSQVYALKPGSYFVTVSPTFDGGATGTFLISKSSQFSVGNVVRTTSSPAFETEEILEITWPENSKLLLRKTGPHHDGMYLVDFNLKNFENIPPPVIPSDTVNRAFVERSISQQMQVKFGGIVVPLKNSDWSQIAPLKPGSYMVAVSSYVRGGPTATFLISKSGDTVAASIFKATDCPGLDSQVQLELQWPDMGKLMLRKTGPFFDGNYLVDFNLKNFTATAPPVLPTDIASKEFVEKEVKDIMAMKWGGIKVTLEDDRYTEVIPLKAGSYTIAVTPVQDGGATSTFHISKSSIFMEGSIVKVSSCPAFETGESLEMQWPPNDKLYLRKTGPFHDGEYIVDFNLKNFSTLPIPQLPAENASRSYVDHAIKETMDAKFGGVVVILKDMVATPVFPMKPGSYVVTVTPLKEGSPTGTFAISKSSSAQDGAVVKITSFPGTDENCQLEILWPANGKVLLRKSNPFHDGNYLVDANLKNFTTLPEPIMPNDSATRSFVETTVKDTMQERFSGIIVNLVEDEISNVIMLKPGSYVVTVSPLQPGGPTSVFNISKTLTDSEPAIVRTSSSPGEGTGEVLQLLWNPNSKLQLKKSGSHHDGDYLVDFNLKNFSQLPPVVLPSDTASKEYVDRQLKNGLEVKFGGVVVTLKDNDYSDVFALRQGSYFISVSPLVPNAPTATFLVSKSNLTDDASIVRMTSIAGKETGETLELIWKENKKLKIRKTGPFYDGDYLIDTNLRNFTETPPPVLPTDTATKEFVQDAIKERMDAKFSGILVDLEGTIDTKVTALRFGSYVVAVSCLQEGGPTGTFMISKNGNDAEASVVNITSCPGDDTGELLSLTWPSNSKLLLKKSGPFYDGRYLVDFNLKNFSNLPSPTIPPSEVVSASFVKKSITEAMEVKYGGIAVNLVGTEFSPVTALKAGSYLVTVSSIQDGNPTATYTISKATQNGKASVVKISSCPGNQDAEANLELIWPENDRILLRKTSLFHDGHYVVDFNLKNFSDAPSVKFPTDVASKAFVEQAIRDKMEEKFSGIVVNLENDSYADVTTLKVGSYVVTVTPLIPNAPTGSWHISKNSQSIDGHVVKVTSCSGVHSGEMLELIWKANEKLKVRKTGGAYDGGYLIDFNLKNFSAVPPPIIPSDIVNRAWVEDAIREQFNTHFSGVKVYLDGTAVSEVIALRAGSYIVAVSPTNSSGPSATFAISKSGDEEEPSVTRLTSCAGKITKENLELLWVPGGKLSLKKTGPGNDGFFIIDMNLKNIPRQSYSVVESDGDDDGGDADGGQDAQRNLYKGIDVVLTGNKRVPIVAMLPGSYLITVSPRVQGGPSATFSISKSTPDMGPSVVKLTGTKGADRNEDLDITWPANDKIYIQKSGNNFDGMYMIDTNLRNMTNVIEQPSVGPSTSMQKYDFTLSGTEEVKICFLIPGSYFAYLSSYETGRYHATYSFIKTSDEQDGEIMPLSLNKSENIDEEFLLSIRWSKENSLYVSKTVNEYDGLYMIKIM